MACPYPRIRFAGVISSPEAGVGALPQGALFCATLDVALPLALSMRVPQMWCRAMVAQSGDATEGA
jgi:hypothetical protein